MQSKYFLGPDENIDFPPVSMSGLKGIFSLKFPFNLTDLVVPREGSAIPVAIRVISAGGN